MIDRKDVLVGSATALAAPSDNVPHVRRCSGRIRARDDLDAVSIMSLQDQAHRSFLLTALAATT